MNIIKNNWVFLILIFVFVAVAGFSNIGVDEVDAGAPAGDNPCSSGQTKGHCLEGAKSVDGTVYVLKTPKGAFSSHNYYKKSDTALKNGMITSSWIHYANDIDKFSDSLAGHCHKWECVGTPSGGESSGGAIVDNNGNGTDDLVDMANSD